MWKVTGKPTTESFEVISNNHYDETKLNQTRKKVTKLETLLDLATKVDLFPGNPDCALNNIYLMINRREISTVNRL